MKSKLFMAVLTSLVVLGAIAGCGNKQTSTTTTASSTTSKVIRQALVPDQTLTAEGQKKADDNNNWNHNDLYTVDDKIVPRFGVKIACAIRPGGVWTQGWTAHAYASAPDDAACTFLLIRGTSTESLEMDLLRKARKVGLHYEDGNDHGDANPQAELWGDSYIWAYGSDKDGDYIVVENLRHCGYHVYGANSPIKAWMAELDADKDDNLAPSPEDFKKVLPKTDAERNKIFGPFKAVTVVCLESGRVYQASARYESDEPVLIDSKSKSMSNYYTRVTGINPSDFPATGMIGLAWSDDEENTADTTYYCLSEIKGVSNDSLKVSAEVRLGLSPNDDPAQQLREDAGYHTDATHQGIYIGKDPAVMHANSLDEAADILFKHRQFGVILEKPSLGNVVYARSQRYEKGQLPMQRWPAQIVLADGRTIYRFCESYRSNGVTYLGSGYKTPAWKGVICVASGRGNTGVKMKYYGYCPEKEKYFNRYFEGKPMRFDPKTDKKI